MKSKRAPSGYLMIYTNGTEILFAITFCSESVAAVAAIPQVHFSGTDERIVPIAIPRRFMLAATAAGAHCARTVSVTGLSQYGDWAKVRPKLLADPLCP